ncbi:MAG TPA: putative sugar nucleotidyl transferase [Bacteroidia bacterium]|jgi:UDP-N-acetylglucosamine diphosphorylase/glucosamine-1-phosphate N-acetyltransferase|nr:putative sugar nucleotidyl transferase [Bacteroidia bacterium]
MSDPHIIFFEDLRENFLPLAWTRPVCELRVGHFTIREKWEKWLNCGSTVLTADHLQSKWNFKPEKGKQNFWINSRVLPSAELVAEILKLSKGEALIKGESVVAMNNGDDISKVNFGEKDHLTNDISIRRSDASCIILHRLHDIFLQNGKAITEDLHIVNDQKNPLPGKFNLKIGDHPLIIGKNLNAECVIFNTTKGPIIIGDDVELMEGSMLRGPLSIGDHAVVKMGAKIYGDTTIGPGCKVGGEISNSVFHSNSNKSHDGFIGNSVIGAWVNLGADTNCSNLKNNYGKISVYNYAIGGEEETGLQFHGCIIGDHVKCGINTMLNTGTVIGVAANIFGSGFPPKFLPDFCWGGAEGLTETEIEKAIENAKRMMSRRGLDDVGADMEILKKIHEATAILRKSTVK